MLYGVLNILFSSDFHSPWGGDERSNSYLKINKIKVAKFK